MGNNGNNSVGSIPIHSPASGVPIRVTSPVRRPLALLALCAAFAAAHPCQAQRTDTVRVEPDTSGPRIRKPPLSPSKAFLGSLILPGFSQSVLGRQRSGAMMLAFEVVAVIMLRESALDVREARRHSLDSVLVSYVDKNGALVPTFAKGGFTPGLIRTRKEHVEDWTAVLVGTHLFAALDALVASVLWDLPAEVAVRGSPQSATVGLRLSW